MHEHEAILQPHIWDTERIVIIGVHSPFIPMLDEQAYFDEFKELVASSGATPIDSMFMKLRTVDPAYFLTTGKREDLVKKCEEVEATMVIFSEPLPVQQERNLSALLRCRIVDRTQLILEIFEKGAHSAESKKQVILARLQYEKSRLAGHGVGMSQQAGYIGGRGPGETQKEKATQHLEYLMIKIRRDLEKLEKIRSTQRKQRLTHNTFHACLIGYTNAGKSTILNALTKGDVCAEDKLFCTLDTTTRELFIDSKKMGVISDTVGFIQQLPHSLIQAFKSTLHELSYAHVLLHIINSADKNWQEHIRIVQEILKELDVADKPIVYVFNKIDRVADIEKFKLDIAAYQPQVLVCALNETDIQPLVGYLKEAHDTFTAINKRLVTDRK
jgi:GTP-binding protein HflX